MSRISAMTIGLVLIFIGAQLFLVKSYLLTPSATRFVQEHFNANNGSQFSLQGNGGFAGNTGSGQNQFLPSSQSASGSVPGQSWPYYRTDDNSSGLFQNSSWQGPSNIASSQFASAQLSGGKRFVPPRWIMWPFLFIGAVFFLHGAALRS